MLSNRPPSYAMSPSYIRSKEIRSRPMAPELPGDRHCLREHVQQDECDSPVGEVDEPVGEGRFGQGQLGNVVGKHKEQDEDPGWQFNRLWPLFGTLFRPLFAYGIRNGTTVAKMDRKAACNLIMIGS